MVLLLSTFYDISPMSQRIIELTHSTTFFLQMNKQNRRIKQLSYDILHTYIHNFYSMMLIFIITSFDVHTELNNHVLQSTCA